MCLFELKLKPVSDSLFFHFLSFCLFILRKHITFPWLSMTRFKIPWLSRPGNWNNKFHDFPGFPWPVGTLQEQKINGEGHGGPHLLLRWFLVLAPILYKLCRLWKLRRLWDHNVGWQRWKFNFALFSALDSGLSRPGSSPGLDHCNLSNCKLRSKQYFGSSPGFEPVASA